MGYRGLPDCNSPFFNQMACSKQSPQLISSFLGSKRGQDEAGAAGEQETDKTPGWVWRVGLGLPEQPKTLVNEECGQRGTGTMT